MSNGVSNLFSSPLIFTIMRILEVSKINVRSFFEHRVFFYKDFLFVE